MEDEEEETKSAVVFITNYPPSLSQFMGIKQLMLKFDNLTVCLIKRGSIMNFNKVEKIWMNLLGEYDVGLHVITKLELCSDSRMPDEYADKTIIVEDERAYTHLGILGYDVELIPRLPGYDALFMRIAYRNSISYEYLKNSIYGR